MTKPAMDVIVRGYDSPDHAREGLNELMSIGWTVIPSPTWSDDLFDCKLSIVRDRTLRGGV